MSDNTAPILSRADTVNLISSLRFHDGTDDERAAIHLKLTTSDAELRIEIQRLTEEIDIVQKVIAGDSITKARLTEERDAAQRFIRAAGYRHCDSAACNCGSWHGGHAMERLAEISDVLPWANGPTILERTQSVVSELSALRAELSKAKDTLKEHEEEHWCFNAEHGQVICLAAIAALEGK